METELLKNNFISIFLENDVLWAKVKENNFTKKHLYEIRDAITCVYKYLLTNKKKIALCFDITQSNNIPLTHIKEIASFFIEKRKISEKVLYCSCLLSNNNIINNIVNGFMYIYPSPIPHKMFSNKRDCLTYIDTLVN